MTAALDSFSARKVRTTRGAIGAGVLQNFFPSSPTLSSADDGNFAGGGTTLPIGFLRGPVEIVNPNKLWVVASADVAAGKLAPNDALGSRRDPDLNAVVAGDKALQMTPAGIIVLRLIDASSVATFASDLVKEVTAAARSAPRQQQQQQQPQQQDERRISSTSSGVSRKVADVDVMVTSDKPRTSLKGDVMAVPSFEPRYSLTRVPDSNFAETSVLHLHRHAKDVMEVAKATLSSSRVVAEAAEKILRTMEAKDAETLAQELRHGRDAEVRVAAARGLGLMGSWGAEWIDDLNKAAESEDQNLRTEAVLAVSKLRPDCKVTQEKMSEMRSTAAAKAMGLAHLIKSSVGGETFATIEAKRSLRAMGELAAVAFAEELRTSGDDARRATAACGIGLVGPSGARCMEELCQAVNASSLDVCTEAVNTLRQIGPNMLAYLGEAEAQAAVAMVDQVIPGFASESQSAWRILQIGSSVKALQEAGISDNNIKAAGFSAQDFRDSGTGVLRLKKAGFSALDILNAGFAKRELEEAGFSAKAFKDICVPEGALRLAGFSVRDFRLAGWNAFDIKYAGYSSKELQHEGYSLEELMDAGFLKSDLDHVTLDMIRNSALPAKALRKAEFTADELFRAGYTTTVLVEAGFNSRELVAAGCSAADFKFLGFTADKLRQLGFTAKCLRRANFDDADLLGANFTKEEIDIASNRQPPEDADVSKPAVKGGKRLSIAAPIPVLPTKIKGKNLPLQVGENILKEKKVEKELNHVLQTAPDTALRSGSDMSIQKYGSSTVNKDSKRGGALVWQSVSCTAPGSPNAATNKGFKNGIQPLCMS